MSLSHFRNLAMSAVALVVLGLIFTADGTAQRLDKKTILTINQPFQIPGVALPAGKYVMKLVDTAGSRSIVRLMDADEKKVYATMLAIPDFKLTTPEKAEFSFYEAKSGLPQPLRAWFYPGRNYGLEFVYPKAKAMEIAKAEGEHVLATSAGPEISTEVAATVEPNEKQMFDEPVFGIEPSGAQVEIAAIHPQSPEIPAMAALKLPKTASPYALLGLAGLMAASLAAALRILRQRT